MSVLFFHTMKYRPEDPRNFNNDRFILSKVRARQSYWPEEEALFSFLCVSKYRIWPFLCISVFFFILAGRFVIEISFSITQGHAAPALYSMWVETGFLKESELLTLCQVDSALEVHLSPVSSHILYHTSGVVSRRSSSVLTNFTNILLCQFRSSKLLM